MTREKKKKERKKKVEEEKNYVSQGFGFQNLFIQSIYHVDNTY